MAADSEVEQRLRALEERVAELEAVTSSAAASDDGPGPAADAGTVGYQGTVRLAVAAQWSIRLDTSRVLDLPVVETAEVLAALGHPLRLQIVRRLLAAPAGATELQAELELRSTGQLYHHLRALVTARIITSTQQTYSVTPDRVVPNLVAMLAAGDIAGLLR